MQSTRLNAYFTTLKHESELKTYVQERGAKVSNRAILTEFRKFSFDHVNNFVFRELNYALANPIVYIDGIRITDKPLLKDGEIEGSSNFFTTNFEGAVDNTDTYTPTPQIFEPFDLIDYLPFGLYSTGSGLPDYEFDFNRLFTIETSEPIKVYKDNVFLFDLQGLVVNGLTLDATEDPTPLNDAGIYKIVIPANKIKSIAGEVLPKTELEYRIRTGQFNSLQFNTNQFLTN
jgi:hypothetical protein